MTLTDKKYLYSRDSINKIRLVTFTSFNLPDGTYLIERSSGILNGKMTKQPDIKILKGLASRTIEEQVELKMNSLVNSKADKGYVEIKVDNQFDENKIDQILPKVKTDASGNRKPMLAKDPKAGDKPKESEFFDLKLWYISPKLDGLRCKGVLVDDEIQFYSRSGKRFKGVVDSISKDPILIETMKKFKCEVDGELYSHGTHLNTISGDCRKEEYDPERHDYIKYYIFDLPHDTRTAKDRFEILNTLETDNPRIKVVKHIPINKYSDILKKHDEYVEQGYEGAMVQELFGLYEFNKRSSTIWKIKLFQDSEFKIISYKLGLRGSEDMCFVMLMEDGRTFEAKPIGPRELKENYVEDFENIKGKMGTVKYFGFTSYGIPNIPTFKCIRDNE